VRLTFRRGAAVDSGREHELVFAAAHVFVDFAAGDRLRRLASADLDWTLVWRLARRNGVAPLVFHTLIAAGAVDAADDKIARLRARFFANAANSMVLARELTDLVAALANAGVAVIPYKGPALAAWLYGNIALREFSDLDVIVAPRDVPAARAALFRHGYEPAIMLTPDRERALVASRTGYFMRFDRPTHAERIALELHWRIPSTFPLEGFEHRLTTVSLLGRPVPHVAPEDLLLLLCAHGVKHAWNQLKWICDVSELIERRPSLDWDSTLEQARRLGGLRVVLLGCAMASRTLQTHLPSSVATCIDRDPVVPGLADWLRRRLVDRPTPRIGVINNVRIRERTADKIRYCAGLVAHLTLPTVSERASWPEWPGAQLVYTLLQPFRVAVRVARKHRRWNRAG
jgi:hypothetical protein